MQAVKQGFTKMRDVKVRRGELLETVKKNRDRHLAEYTDSVKGYKQAAIAEIDKAMSRLKRQVEELESGQTLVLAAVRFDLEVPQNHTKDYDQVIKMLEMSVDDELTIRSDEFACYVMDDWSWRQEFEFTKSRYTR